MKKILLTALLLLSVASLAPAAALAQQNKEVKLDYSGFVNCDGEVNPDEPYRKEKCDFAKLMAMFNKIINWLFYISIPAAAIMFAYAGVLYMTGTQGNIGTAKKIFINVAVGFIIMISAWFIVKQVLSWFVDDPTVTTFLGK